jgi:hypothetical protein
MGRDAPIHASGFAAYRLVTDLDHLYRELLRERSRP